MNSRRRVNFIVGRLVIDTKNCEAYENNLSSSRRVNRGRFVLRLVLFDWFHVSTKSFEES